MIEDRGREYERGQPVRTTGEGVRRIRLIAASILDNHPENDRINARFRNIDRNETRRKVTEFICAGTGGPQHYTNGNACRIAA